MLIPRINRGLPDKVFAIVRNMHSAALVDGDCVTWLLSSETPPTGYTRIPGVDVKQSAGVDNACVGVMSVAGVNVAVGDYGLCQVFGYHPNVKTSVAALAVNTVVTATAAGVALAASVAALANITDRRIGVCTTVGAGNRAGIQLHCM